MYRLPGAPKSAIAFNYINIMPDCKTPEIYTVLATLTFAINYSQFKCVD